MIFGVSPTKDAVVIAQSTGAGETFVIQSIRSIQFQARSGDGLKELLQRLVIIFDLSSTSRGSTIALLGSSSGRFKSSVEAIKGEAITELAAAKSGLPVVRVTAASLKKVLGCAPGQKWQARAEELFNPGNTRKNWSRGAVGAAAAAFKIAEGQPTGIRSAIISLSAADIDSRGESRSLKSTSTASREKKTGLLASTSPPHSLSPSSASILKSLSDYCL
jgi:hypothetical protein